MIHLEQVKSYFPDYMQSPAMQKYMLKEYIQLMALDYLTTTPHLKNLAFIGGTYQRLKFGIDRFSEDLDFDCKGLSREDFLQMTGDVLQFLRRSGLNAEIRKDQNPKLKAFRRNIYFPELLFEMGLSGYKNERFLIKIEAEDQQIPYETKMQLIKGCGFVFSFPAPPDAVVCAMKISALLSRRKGRDFYDAMYLLQITQPDYEFLKAKTGISNLDELKDQLLSMVSQTDLNLKVRDFEHLAFKRNNNKRVLLFNQFIAAL